MTAPLYTAEEIAAAYRKSRLRYIGITLLRALNDPLLYKALCLQARVMRSSGNQPTCSFRGQYE